MDAKLIKPAKNETVLIKREYNTDDIITAVLQADKETYSDVSSFVKSIQYSNLTDLAKQLFDFVFYNIKYVEDPIGNQYIKRPSALYSTKFGDCKSMALFISACLKNLGIPYYYRFVSFSSIDKATHVYVVMYDENNKLVIIDPVVKKFNYQKPYTFKHDYMNGLYRVNGIGDAKSETMLNFRTDIDNMSEAEMELEIARQRLEIEKQIVANVRGINSTKVAEYQATINGLNQFKGALLSGNYEAVGAMIGKAKKKKTKAGKFMEKIVNTAKKGAKAVVKVATAPARLLVKGILEVSLPKASPAFLYLFINDPKLLAKLPEKVKRKRAKQEKIASFIVDKIGMKRNHFMGILRNGIMKKYKKSPEKVIAETFKGIAGIGVLPALIPLAITAINFIIKKLGGGKDNEMSADDAIDPSDAQGMPNKVIEEMNKTGNDKAPGTSLDETTDSGDNGGSIIDNQGGKKLFGIC